MSHYSCVQNTHHPVGRGGGGGHGFRQHVSMQHPGTFDMMSFYSLLEVELEVKLVKTTSVNTRTLV